MYLQHDVGPVLLNSLPEDMRLADSLNFFKSHLKTHYFKLAYCMTCDLHHSDSTCNYIYFKTCV